MKFNLIVKIFPKIPFVLMLISASIAFTQTNNDEAFWQTGSNLIYMTGDFNGDGAKDEVRFKTESKLNGYEINSIPYTDSISLFRNYCDSFPVISLNEENGALKSFVISDNCIYFNILSVMNLGDLNQDGGDEILVVLSGFFDIWPPTFEIYSYQNEWKLVGQHKLYHIPAFNDYFDIEKLIDYQGHPMYISEDGSRVELINIP